MRMWALLFYCFFPRCAFAQSHGAIATNTPQAGNKFEIRYGGALLTDDDRIAVVATSVTCGQAGAMTMHTDVLGLTTEQPRTGGDDFASFWTDVRLKNGDLTYRVCRCGGTDCARPANEHINDWFDDSAGYLNMKGPAANQLTLTYQAGVSQAFTFSGKELGSTSKVTLTKAGVCGTIGTHQNDPAVVEYTYNNLRSSGSDTSSTYETVDIREYGIYFMCWCFDHDDCVAEGNMYHVQLGMLTVQGPDNEPIVRNIDVRAGQFWDLSEIDGAGNFNTASNIRMILDTIICGAVGAGTNAPHVTIEDDSSGSSWINVKILALEQASYRICWCGRSTCTDTQYNVDLATVVVEGPSWHQLDLVETSGYEFDVVLTTTEAAAGDIIILHTALCGTATTSDVAVTVGAATNDGDEQTFTVTVGDNAPGVYNVCWCGVGGENCDTMDEFQTSVGTVKVFGPYSPGTVQEISIIAGVTFDLIIDITNAGDSSADSLLSGSKVLVGPEAQDCTGIVDSSEGNALDVSAGAELSGTPTQTNGDPGFLTWAGCQLNQKGIYIVCWCGLEECIADEHFTAKAATITVNGPVYKGLIATIPGGIAYDLSLTGTSLSTSDRIRVTLMDESVDPEKECGDADSVFNANLHGYSSGSWTWTWYASTRCTGHFDSFTHVNKQRLKDLCKAACEPQKLCTRVTTHRNTCWLFKEDSSQLNCFAAPTPGIYKYDTFVKTFAATEVYGVLPISNPDVATLSTTSETWGKVVIREHGLYYVCWCSKGDSCISSSDFAVKAAVLTVQAAKWNGYVETIRAGDVLDILTNIVVSGGDVPNTQFKIFLNDECGTHVGDSEFAEAAGDATSAVYTEQTAIHFYNIGIHYICWCGDNDLEHSLQDNAEKCDQNIEYNILAGTITVLGASTVDSDVLVYNEVINIEFDLEVIGTGMQDTDKIRMVADTETCGEGSANTDDASVTNPNAGARQASEITTSSTWQLTSSTAGAYKICWCGLNACNDAVHFYKHIATVTIHDVIIADRFLLYGVPSHQNRTKMSYFSFQWVSHKMTYFEAKSCEVEDSVEDDTDFTHDEGTILEAPVYYYSITCPSITYIPNDDPPTSIDHILYWWHEAKNEWKDCNYDKDPTSNEPTIECMTVAGDTLYECHPAEPF